MNTRLLVIGLALAAGGAIAWYVYKRSQAPRLSLVATPQQLNFIPQTISEQRGGYRENARPDEAPSTQRHVVDAISRHAVEQRGGYRG